MSTVIALSCHTRNRFMLTNLACPISRLRGEWDYITVQRLHHRQTGNRGTEGWKDASEDNKWMISKSLNPRNIDKSVCGYPDPYPVPIWKQFLDIRIRLHTHYPAGYPTGKPDNDHLCCAMLWFETNLVVCLFWPKMVRCRATCNIQTTWR